MVKVSILVAVLIVSFVASCGSVTTTLQKGESTYYLKQIAGPPTEFALHSLPTPSEGAQFQQSSYTPMWASSQKSKLAGLPQSTLYQGSVVVDSTEEFQLSFMTPLQNVQLTLTDPNNNNVDLSAGVVGTFPIGQETIPATSWSFVNPIVGVYTLTLTSTSSKITRDSVSDDETPVGYYIVLNLSPIVMVGQLSTYNMQQGQPVGLIATVVQSPSARNIAKYNAIDSDEVTAIRVSKSAVINAVMTVTLPDGNEEDVQMVDDGLHGDMEANDGIYGAQVTASEVGTYQMQAVIQGTTAEGIQFFRTTQHLIASVPDGLSLVGTASAVNVDPTHLNISINVDFSSQIMNIAQTYTAYAEVFGVDVNGQEAAACFISGITQVLNVGTDNEIINLVLNLDWLSYSNVQPPLTLKNVVLQDMQAYVPIASASSIPVTMSAVTHAKIISHSQKKVVEITQEMRQGQIPQEILAKQKGDAAGAVILVHGYCSSSNPWSPNPNDWSNAYYFLDTQASRSHDEFAQLVLDYANSLGLGAYSLVGHSQGGIVSAHILNFYFSGMDLVTDSGYKIQSIGTPYEGCSVAGGWAGLGSSFGIGCGENFDLSLDGSKLWLPSITVATRQQIFYYTTTYKQGNLFGDSCSAAINMVLEWPNDGVAELEYTNIPYANNMGNTQQQCHTTNMNYVAQYYDNARNKKMNSNSAR